MKKPQYSKLISTSEELKPRSKFELKPSLSTRSTDAKFLLKNDHIKEMLKLNSNIQSRDVSYIREKHPFSLPKLTPLLPTDLSHLTQLYHSSDNFGMPVSISSQNLASSVTCKKQSCIEKVLSTHDSSSIVFEDFTTDYIERLNLGNPSGRQDIKNLQNWLIYMKEAYLNNLKLENGIWTNDVIEKSEIVFTMAGKELVRQVSVHCIERGEVLKEILWFFSSLHRYQKLVYSKEVKDRVEAISKENDEKVYKHARQIANYEICLKKKREKLAVLKNKCEELEGGLKAANAKMMALAQKYKNEGLKGFIFNSKQISPAFYKNQAKKRESKTQPKKSENFEEKEENGVFEKNEFKITIESQEKTPELETIKNNENLEEEKPENSKIFEKSEKIEENSENVEETFPFENSLKITVSEKGIQTDPMKKEQKHRFEFRLHSGVDKQSIKAINFKIESSASLSIHSSAVKPQENPKILQLAEDHSRKKSNYQLSKMPKQRSESVLMSPIYLESKTKNFSNGLSEKRQSLMTSFDPESKKLSSPNNLLEVPNSSLQNPLPETIKDDILMMQILTKQQAYKDLTLQTKSKKTELESVSAELDEKQNSLNAMKREIQFKYLELQAINIPTAKNASQFKRAVMQKFEGIREERSALNKENNQVLLEVNGTNVTIDASLQELIPQNLDIISWKTGFNAGFEKGLSVGLMEGEQLGKEVGEEEGYAKFIIETKNLKNEGFDNLEETDNEHEVFEQRTIVEENEEGFIESKDLDEIKEDEFCKGNKEVYARIDENKEIDEEIYKGIKENNENEDNIIIEENDKETMNTGNKNRRVLKTYLRKQREKVQNSLQIIHNETIFIQKSSNSDSSNKALLLPEDHHDNFNSLQLEETESISNNEKQTLITSENSNNHKTLKTSKLDKENPKTTEKTPENQKELIKPTEEPFEAKKSGKDQDQKLQLTKKKSLKPRLSPKNTESDSEKHEDSEKLLENKTLEAETPDSEKQWKKKDQEQIRKRIKDLTKFNEFNFYKQKSHIFQKKNNNSLKLLEDFLKKKLDRILKISKMSKRMAFRLLNLIYLSYIQKMKSNEPIQDLFDHSYEDFLSKYSLKSVCEKKLLELVASLLKFSDCKRALVYLKLTNISEKLGIPGYSSFCISFYMTALNFMLNSKIGIVVGLDDTADKVMIPVVRAVECAKELFEGKIDRPLLGKLINKLENSAIKDPKKINQGGLIENELGLEIMLDFYENYSKNIVVGVGFIINVIKYKEDSSFLTKSELNLLIKNISPNKYKEDDSDDSEILTIGVVSLICLEKNVLSMDEINNFIVKEEGLAGNKEILSDKPLFLSALEKGDRKVKGIESSLWKEKINNLYEGLNIRDSLESFIAWRLYSNEILSN